MLRSNLVDDDLSYGFSVECGSLVVKENLFLDGLGLLVVPLVGSNSLLISSIS